MEQAKKLRMEAIEMIKGSMGNFIFPHQFWLDVENALDIYVQQIRSEEQAKTRETAIEFVKWMDKQGIANLFRDDNKKMDYFDTEKMFYEWFANKAQHCSECGKPMEKKEIIIKGDIDTCDECLCPE